MNPLLDVSVSGIFAPKPAQPRQWCSVSGLKFHLEKPASQARGLNWFEALCGVTGDFMHERFDGQTFLQCADCVQISSANILDVADQTIVTGNTPLKGGITVGNEGGESPAMISPLKTLCANCGLEITQILDYADSPYWNDKTKPYGWHHVEATSNSDGQYQTFCTGEFDGCEAEPSFPSDTAHGIAGVQSTATDCTPETPFIRAIDHFTFRYLRFVDERLSIHALEQIAAKLPDLSLAEQYRLEDIDAARESGVL